MADITTLMGLGALGAFIAAFAAIAVIVFIAVYIYCAIALMTIAKKTNTQNAWLAWIPIANIYLMLMIAGLPWWCIFGLLLPMIPVLGSLALIAGMAYVWWKIAEARGKEGWLGILTIIPVVNLIIMGILAWSD